MSDSIAQPLRVLFVCTGNICRSPTAEVVVRDKAAAAGLDGRLHLESAGTTGYHVGEPPDRRAIAAARRRGYDLSGLRARKVVAEDFARFDLLLAMADGHLRQLRGMAPARRRDGVRPFLDFAAGAGARDVPDPYYGGAQGFETMLDLIEQGAEGFLAAVARGDFAR